MRPSLFGLEGVVKGTSRAFSSGEFRLTKHAHERIRERANCSNPMKEVRKLAAEGLLLSNASSVIKISDGEFTMICSMDRYPYAVITFRRANYYEMKFCQKRISGRAYCSLLRKR